MNFSKLLLVLASMLVFHIQLPAQSTTQKIKAIRLEFQSINRDSSLRTVTIDDSEEFLGHATDGGGELTGYFKKDSIRKIVVKVGLSYGEISDECYFKNEKLIFVYETEKHFGTIGDAINHEKLSLAFEGRYYFDKDKLIDKKEKGSGRFSESKERDQVILSAIEQYLSLLKSKRK